jgi:hypothetical protein
VRLTDAGKEEQSRKLDKITLGVLSLAFFGGMLLIVVLR